VPRRKRSRTDARTDGKRSPQAPGAEAKDDESSEATRGVYMISVAAELAGMHPQTLRIYEARGLITPQRSPKNTRLYSQEDVERLRRIQELTTEMGMNLAGVERVFELEGELERMRRRMRNFQRHAERIQSEFEEELERVRRSFKRELVRYEPPGKALLPRDRDRARAIGIPFDRGDR
jgi:MerR family transcriptional regulator/heat shock protein HspR